MFSSVKHKTHLTQDIIKIYISYNIHSVQLTLPTTTTSSQSAANSTRYELRQQGDMWGIYLQ